MTVHSRSRLFWFLCPRDDIGRSALGVSGRPRIEFSIIFACMCTHRQRWAPSRHPCGPHAPRVEANPAGGADPPTLQWKFTAPLQPRESTWRTPAPCLRLLARCLLPVAAVDGFPSLPALWHGAAMRTKRFPCPVSRRWLNGSGCLNLLVRARGYTWQRWQRWQPLTGCTLPSRRLPR